MTVFTKWAGKIGFFLLGIEFMVPRTLLLETELNQSRNSIKKKKNLQKSKMTAESKSATSNRPYRCKIKPQVPCRLILIHVICKSYLARKFELNS